MTSSLTSVWKRWFYHTGRHRIVLVRPDLPARESLSYFLLWSGKPADGVTVAKEGIRDCGSVLAHRNYQDVRRASGEAEAVLAEYASLTAADPGNAMLHYLHGQLIDDPEPSRQEMREALRLDPDFGWAHVGLGYQALAAGRYGEATTELTAALRSGTFDDDTVLLATEAAIAAGRLEEAHAAVGLLKGSGLPASVWRARFILALAEKRWDDVRAMLDRREKSGVEAETFFARAQSYAVMADDAQLRKHIDDARANKELATAVAVASIQRALTAGEFSAAAAEIDQSRASFGWMAGLYELYAAAGLMIEADRGAAETRLREAKANIAESEALGDDARALLATMAAALTDNVDAAAVIADTTRQNIDFLRHAYFFLGARAMASGHVARARAMFAKSAETSFDLDFPRQAAQRLAPAQPPKDFPRGTAEGTSPLSSCRRAAPIPCSPFIVRLCRRLASHSSRG